MIKRKRIWALYKGDTYITDGTIPEIAKKIHKSEDTLLFYTRPTYQRRIQGHPDRLCMVDLTEDD